MFIRIDIGKSARRREKECVILLKNKMDQKLKAKKSLGQHFLHSKSALAKIIEASKISRGNLVLEIGPGTGILTEALLDAGAKVLAIEKDDRAFMLLSEKFATQIKNGDLILEGGDVLELGSDSKSGLDLELESESGFVPALSLELGSDKKTFQVDTIILEDIGKLKMVGSKKGSDEQILEYMRETNPNNSESKKNQISNLLKEKEYKLVANIPYYITGAILRKFLEYGPRPTDMVILVQKEVAERVVARDGKESILSMSVKVFGTPSIYATIPKGAFVPVPSVDSAILVINDISADFFEELGTSDAISRENNVLIPNKIQEFFEILRAGFAHKRKILKSNLQSVCDIEKIEKAWNKQGLKTNIRAEDLKKEWWRGLFESLNQ